MNSFHRNLHRTLAGALVALGCIHNFVAAPATFERLSERALWFVTAGLSLWYAGFINLLLAGDERPTRSLQVYGALTNVTLLAFVIGFTSVKESWGRPEALLLVSIVLILTMRVLWRLIRLQRAVDRRDAA